MKGFAAPALLIALLLLTVTNAHAAETKGRDAGAIYAELCANCHGPNLEGAKGPALRPGALKHGDDEAALLSGIRDGYASNGMPGFAPSMNDAELLALVTFVREVETRATHPQAQISQPPPPGVQRSEEHSYRIESVAEGLDVPWSLAFLPDERILVTERVGRLRIIENGRLNPEPVEETPTVIARDEAGLMSVVAHPDFAHNQWVYLTFADPGDKETAMTKVIRGRLEGNRLVDQTTIFGMSRAKYPKGYVLFGSRLVFQGDYLFFSVGVRGLETDIGGRAQDLTVPNGKIHRLFHDGKIPPDNPFVSQPTAWHSIWAYGVRNPQGLALDPRNGDLWETEHGPRGGDELNLIRGGKNYGWPLITHGINYDGTPISDKNEASGMEQPVLHWTPSIAPSEIEFYTGDRFPKWKNNLFMGTLAQQTLYRFVVEAGRVTHQEEVFKNLGRIRDIKTAPDGTLYLALEIIGGLGRIVRLVPAEESSGSGAAAGAALK